MCFFLVRVWELGVGRVQVIIFVIGCDGMGWMGFILKTYGLQCV